ncbi:MAG: chemotaxis protein methyltransferase CheR [Planctomycetota bacterium]|nr:chemotaxis protein methyltransferase CheR [Planctomycetota bacterium]
MEFCSRIRANPATASIPILPLFRGHFGAGGRAEGSGEVGNGHPSADVEPRALIAAIEALLRVRVTRERFQGFLEAAPDAVVIATPDGRIDQINAQTERLFGYGRDELIGQPVEILMPARFRRRHVEHREAYVAGPSTRPMGTGLDLYGLRKDGEEFPIEISLSPLPTEGGVLAASIIRDITAHRKLEAELRQGKLELEQAQRHKDEFLATLAHELRNPLAPIRNAVACLGMAGLTQPDLESARDVIARQVSQMVRLIDDLLDVSRISRNRLELRKERVELAAVVQGALESSRPLIEQCGHELTVSLPPLPVYVDADPTRLGQVILNLLNNAAKYTERGGHVRLTAERQGGDVVLSVRDSGVGISPEMLPHVFDLFTQVDRSLERSQGGLGIGLTLVRRLVEMHGGSVEARSGGHGTGSEFVVRLPIVVATPTQPTAPEDETGPAEPAESRRILVVDDNLDSARTMARLLKLMGHQTCTANDGGEAVEAAEEHRPEVILLDIGLPVLNGYDVARTIRERPWGGEVVIVALTGWGQEGDRLRSQEAGIDHHLVKPVDPAALEKILSGLRAAPVSCP